MKNRNNRNADAITFISHRHNNIPVVKVAVYSRKSSEEGLEQEFNSLDAHREACKAYIQSQPPAAHPLGKRHFAHPVLGT